MFKSQKTTFQRPEIKPIDVFLAFIEQIMKSDAA